MSSWVKGNLHLVRELGPLKQTVQEGFQPLAGCLRCRFLTLYALQCQKDLWPITPKHYAVFV